MDEQASQSRQQFDRMSQAPPRSSPAMPNQRRFDESWIEVSSQPSSSSLSSIGDEIVTTGLQIRSQSGRRRRMSAAAARSLPHQQTAIHAGGMSSQEDYGSSSDDDDGRPLASSAENLPSNPEADDSDDADADSDATDSDDGDNATALGGRTSDRPIFRPQPNAFSHPPSHPQRSYSTNTAIPPQPHGNLTRPSFTQRSQTRVHRGAPNFMSPPAREDDHAALRASLTTLLSCAAAARGLPKTREEAEAQRATRAGVGPSDQPMGLRLVPEAELMEEEAPCVKEAGLPTSPPRKRSSTTQSPSRAEEGSRKSRRSASAGRTPRATRKKTSSSPVEETLISPTLLTWVVSAGVVVLVSVVGFGAGYVIGREVGRQEALAAGVGGVNETASCGREAIRTSSGTLRRFKWSTVGRSIVA